MCFNLNLQGKNNKLLTNVIVYLYCCLIIFLITSYVLSLFINLLLKKGILLNK